MTNWIFLLLDKALGFGRLLEAQREREDTLYG